MDPWLLVQIRKSHLINENENYVIVFALTVIPEKGKILVISAKQNTKHMYATDMIKAHMKNSQKPNASPKFHNEGIPLTMRQIPTQNLTKNTQKLKLHPPMKKTS